MVNATKCMIIGSVPILDDNIFKEFNPREYYVICADGGFATAQKYGIKPDFTVGDFDSLGYIPESEEKNVKILQEDKDVTDTMYAAMLGLKKGYKNFVLLGCFRGERDDHTVANYNVMVYLARKGAFPIMADDENKVFLLSSSRLKITNQVDSIVSVFPFGSTTCTVSYEGLKYKIKNKTLSVGDELMGVSNKVISENAEIYVHAGYALVMIYSKIEKKTENKQAPKQNTRRYNSNQRRK